MLQHACKSPHLIYATQWGSSKPDNRELYACLPKLPSWYLPQASL